VRYVVQPGAVFGAKSAERQRSGDLARGLRHILAVMETLAWAWLGERRVSSSDHSRLEHWQMVMERNSMLLLRAPISFPMTVSFSSATVKRLFSCVNRGSALDVDLGRRADSRAGQSGDAVSRGRTVPDNPPQARSRRSAMGTVDWHQHREGTFCHKRSRQRLSPCSRHRFDRLIIIAPPKILGQLAKHATPRSSPASPLRYPRN